MTVLIKQSVLFIIIASILSVYPDMDFGPYCPALIHIVGPKKQANVTSIHYGVIAHRHSMFLTSH